MNELIGKKIKWDPVVGRMMVPSKLLLIPRTSMLAHTWQKGLCRCAGGSYVEMGDDPDYSSRPNGITRVLTGERVEESEWEM